MTLPLTGAFDTARLPRIAADPVTITVARRVLPGWEAEFLRWADDLLGAIRQAPGCLGAAVFSPGQAGGEYQIIARFANGVLLRQWERSAIRNELMDRSELFVIGTRLQRTVGVEEWFEAAAHAQPKRPWWKRLFIDVAWIYPVSMAMALFISPSFVSLPLAARVLLGAAIITITVQLVVGPLRSRLRAKRRL
jgi:antibiotic biosynthesis monooxygenase (ABM) superfamily enzyme